MTAQANAATDRIRAPISAGVAFRRVKTTAATIAASAAAAAGSGWAANSRATPAASPATGHPAGRTASTQAINGRTSGAGCNNTGPTATQRRTPSIPGPARLTRTSTKTNHITPTETLGPGAPEVAARPSAASPPIP